MTMLKYHRPIVQMVNQFYITKMLRRDFINHNNFQTILNYGNAKVISNHNISNHSILYYYNAKKIF